MFKGGPGHASTLCYSLKSKEQKKDKLWDEAQECIYIYIYIYIYTHYTHMYVCMFAWAYQMKSKKIEKVICYNF